MAVPLAHLPQIEASVPENVRWRKSDVGSELTEAAGKLTSTNCNDAQSVSVFFPAYSDALGIGATG